MQSLKSIIRSNTFYVIAFAFLIVYVGLRAAFVNMTHDEAWSFHNVKNFWYVEFLCTGNSHWFNSLAMQTSILAGCENVFCLRWLSIISFIVTCFFGGWFIRSVKSKPVQLLAFCLIFLNPYLLDYFGLARGYAGGIMFECLAILLFVNGIKTNERKHLFAALVFSGLSAISNYSFVYFYFAFVLVYFFTVYFRSEKKFINEKPFYIDTVIALAIAALIIRAFIFMIRCSGDFKGAGEPSFLSMFHVFSDGLLYAKITLPKLIKYAFSLGLFIIITIAVYIGLVKKEKHSNTLYYNVSLILTIMITTMVFNYLCFSVVYPFYRAAQLLFIPVYIILASFADYQLTNYKPTPIILYSISFLLILNFSCSINFKYTFDFREQADSEDCFNRVQILNAKHVGISPELYGVFANYYQMTDTKKYNFIGDFINTWGPKGICPVNNKLAEFDYLILYPPYDLNYYRNSNVSFTAVHLSPTTRTLILRVEKKP